MPPLRKTRKWPSTKYANGYVEERNGRACMRYKGARRATGLLWTPKNRGEAVGLLDNWILSILHPELAAAPESAAGSGITLYGAIDEFRKLNYGAFGLAKRDNYDRAFNAYVVADLPIDAAGPLRSALADQNNRLRLAPNTRNKYLGYLSLFFEECVRLGWTPENPVEAIGIPHRMQKLEILIFTLEELETIIQQVLKRPDGRDYASLYRFQALTGLRIGETLKLHLTDIDDQAIKVEGKGRRPRVVPIHVIPGLRELLDEIRSLPKASGIRIHGSGGKLFRWTDPGKPRQVFNDACEDAKVMRGTRTLHTLRGTAGWWMENKLGWDERTICDVLGQEPETRKKHYRTQPSASELEARIHLRGQRKANLAILPT